MSQTVSLNPDEIAVFAYWIWEHEGRPDGHALNHWLEAERQLLATRAQNPSHDS